MAYALDGDHENAEDSRPTLYDAYRWGIVNASGTQCSEQFRANMNAHWIACGSVAALEAALKPYEEELEALDDEAYEYRLQQLATHILEEAEQVTLGFTEEVDQEIRLFESKLCLDALRHDMLTPQETDTALCLLFGEFRYLEARPLVENLLTSRDQALRRRALEVLVLHWDLASHRETAFRFLSDPDPECRKQGMRCLNPGGNVLYDLSVLRAYARIALNATELTDVRLAAYSELLMAAGFELDHDHWREIELFLEEGGPIEQAPRIDWDLVRTFHESSDDVC